MALPRGAGRPSLPTRGQADCCGGTRMSGVRTELLLRRLDRRLRGDVAFARRRAIRRELRANLAEATQRVGEREAIRQLGDLDEIAADYRTAAGRGEMPFRPDSGLRAVLWTTLALMAFTLIRIPTFGMVNTFDAYTGQQQWEWGVRYLWLFHGDISTSTLFEGSVFWTTFVLFGTAAFLIWSAGVASAPKSPLDGSRQGHHGLTPDDTQTPTDAASSRPPSG